MKTFIQNTINFVKDHFYATSIVKILVIIGLGGLLIAVVHFTTRDGQLSVFLGGQQAAVIQSFEVDDSISDTPTSEDTEVPVEIIIVPDTPTQSEIVADILEELQNSDNDEVVEEEQETSGGGGGGSSRRGNGPRSTEDTSTPTTTPATVQEDTPMITSPTDGATTTDTTITFSGTSNPDVDISQDFDATTAAANGSGNWTMDISGFSVGTTTIEFFATGATTTISDAISIEVVVENAPADTTDPEVDSYTSQNTTLETCQASAGTAPECNETTQSVTLTWATSDNVGVQSVQILQDGDTATTFLTDSDSMTLNLSQGSYTFQITVKDSAGNSSTETKTVNIIAPVPDASPVF